MLTRAYILKQAALMGFACTTVYAGHDTIKRAVHKVTHARPHKPHKRAAVRRTPPPAVPVYVARTVLECPSVALPPAREELLTLPAVPQSYAPYVLPGGGYYTPPPVGGLLVPPPSPPGVVVPPPPVAAVPEPATWGAMAVGFGGIGLALRRRRTARHGAHA